MLINIQKSTIKKYNHSIKDAERNSNLPAKRVAQISTLSRDSDIEPDQYKSFVLESHVRQQIFVVFEDFCGQKKQNPTGFR